MGGTVTVDGLSFSSAPSAAHVLAPAGNPNVDLFLRETASATPSIVTLAFRLRLAAWKVPSYRRLAQLTIGGLNSVKLNVMAGQVILTEVDPKQAEFNHPMHAFDLTDGTWHSAELRVNMSSAPVVVSLRLDGVTLDMAATLITAASPWKPGAPVAAFGPLSTLAQASPLDTFFDDVTLSNQ